MSSAAVELRPVATPGRVGQGTAVEQSRAVAEVQAQVIVAQQMPRDINRANREMLRSCAMKSLAEKAFYRYKRAGTQITGPTVQLARELARCFGNIQYGITELRRDDVYGQSEMLAFAWDLETNTRSATTFIVQHVRDTKDGSKNLTDQRDIYELNANNGARRLREMIFAILPGWYTEDAVAACYATLAADNSDGATAAERAANAVARFGKIGVTAAQLEQKLGAPQTRWAPSDLAQLAVIWKSVERGETTADAEFGPSAGRISAADLAPPKIPSPAGTETTPAPSPSAPPPDVPPAGEALATSGQYGIVNRLLEKLGMGGEQDEQREARVRVASKLLPVPRSLKSTKEMTRSEAAHVREKLAGCETPEDLAALLDEIALGADPRDEDGTAAGE